MNRKLGLLSAALLLFSCRPASPVDPQQTSAQSLTLGPCNVNVACAFAITTPATLAPTALVLDATSSLQIDDRVTVKETSGSPATIANVGTGVTQIGTDGKLGEIWSRGPAPTGDPPGGNG